MSGGFGGLADRLAETLSPGPWYDLAAMGPTTNGRELSPGERDTVLDAAAAMGVMLLTEEQYRELQLLGGAGFGGVLRV